MAEFTPTHDDPRPLRKVTIRLKTRDQKDATKILKELAERFPVGELDAEIDTREDLTVPDEVLETQIHRVAGNLLDQIEAREQAKQVAAAETPDATAGTPAAEPVAPERSKSWGLAKVIAWLVFKSWKVSAEVLEPIADGVTVAEAVEKTLNSP